MPIPGLEILALQSVYSPDQCIFTPLLFTFLQVDFEPPSALLIAKADEIREREARLQERAVATLAPGCG